MSLRVAAFYRFIRIADPQASRAEVETLLAGTDGLSGTVLIAEEGINATLAGKSGSIESAVAGIADLLNVELAVKWSVADTAPFHRLRVRVRSEIITFEQPSADPTALTGRHVDAVEWHELLQRDDVLVLDVRNDYEIHAGRFRGSVSPQTESFTDFAHYVENELSAHQHRPVAMYCTGGIRCEKASSLLLQQGFKDVAQLQGGVLGYFDQVDSRDVEKAWVGDCFVFDARTSLTPELRPGAAVTCRGCGWPVSPEEQLDRRFKPGKRCPQCAKEGVLEHNRKAL